MWREERRKEEIHGEGVHVAKRGEQIEVRQERVNKCHLEAKILHGGDTVGDQ